MELRRTLNIQKNFKEISRLECTLPDFKTY